MRLVCLRHFESYSNFYKPKDWDYIEEYETLFNEIFLKLAIHCRADSLNLSKFHLEHVFRQGIQNGEMKAIRKQYNKYINQLKINRRRKKNYTKVFDDYHSKIQFALNSSQIYEDIWLEFINNDKTKANELSVWKQSQSCFADLYFSGEDFFSSLLTNSRLTFKEEFKIKINEIIKEDNWSFWRIVRNCISHFGAKIEKKQEELKLHENKIVIIDDSNQKQLINDKVAGLEKRFFICDGCFNILPQDIWLIYNFLVYKSRELYNFDTLKKRAPFD